MNTSLDEIETLASNYDDRRMQLWQALRPIVGDFADAVARSPVA
jgi:hypothetical protein